MRRSNEHGRVQPIREVEYNNLLIVRGADDPPNIKFDIKYMTDVTVLELSNELAGVEVPNFDRFVVTCADESASDRIERESPNKLFMTGQSSEALPTRGGPDFNLAVIRAGDNQVVLEFDAGQTPVMTLEGLEVFPSGEIPHHHLTITASANDPVALEPDCIYWTLMPFKSSE